MSLSLCARAGLALCMVLTATLSLAPANTPTTLTPTEKENALRLMRKLGDASFKAREAASDELVRMGRAVEPVLREGLAYPDPEVRQRCKRLIPLAMSYDREKYIRAFLADKNDKGETILAGWPRFKELAGHDDAARLLFVNLYRNDGEFMEALAKDPAGAAQRYQAKCHEFMNAFNFNGGRVQVAPEQVALLLFASFEPKLKSDVQSQSYLSAALTNLSYQPTGKPLLRDNTMLRKMVVAHVIRADSTWAYNNLQLLANLDLREEGLEIAKKMLAGMGAGRDGHSKAMALSLIGKLGTKENVADIEPFLEEKSVLQTIRWNNNPQITTQVRDVALANLAKLSGHELRDYKFSYFQQMPQGVKIDIHSNPNIWGFSDEATRTASIKKWKDWWEKEKAKPKK